MREHAISRAGQDEREGTPELDSNAETYAVAATRAFISLADAKSRMFQFCSKLPADRSEPLNAAGTLEVHLLGLDCKGVSSAYC